MTRHHLNDLIFLSGGEFAKMLRALNRNMINFRKLVGIRQAMPEALWDYPELLDEARRLINVMLVVKDALTISYSRYTDQEIIDIDDVMIDAKRSEADVARLLLWLKVVLGV